MIAGVLLAAGQATRFGAHKLLHPLPDGTPIAVAAARALSSGVDDIIAVVRANDAPLIALFEQQRIFIAPFDDAARGMGASLAYGVNAMPEATGWLISLADMPFVAPGTIARVADALRRGAPLAAPFCQGRQGHPVGFAREFFTALGALSGDEGARNLLAAHALRLERVVCNDPGILRDVDTPDDIVVVSSEGMRNVGVRPSG